MKASSINSEYYIHAQKVLHASWLPSRGLRHSKDSIVMAYICFVTPITVAGRLCGFLLDYSPSRFKKISWPEHLYISIRYLHHTCGENGLHAFELNFGRSNT
jgi:hypothetical protein